MVIFVDILISIFSSYKQRMKKMYEDEDDIELDTSYHMNTPDVSSDSTAMNISNATSISNMTIEID